MKWNMGLRFWRISRGAMLPMSVISREEAVLMENYLDHLLREHVMKISIET